MTPDELTTVPTSGRDEAAEVRGGEEPRNQR